MFQKTPTHGYSLVISAFNGVRGVPQVTWQRGKACDLGNDNHIAQALLTGGAEPRGGSPLGAASPSSEPPGAHPRLGLEPSRDLHVLQGEPGEQRKGTELGPYRDTRAPARLCLLRDLGQIHRNSYRAEFGLQDLFPCPLFPPLEEDSGKNDSLRIFRTA